MDFFVRQKCTIIATSGFNSEPYSFFFKKSFSVVVVAPEQSRATRKMH